MSSLVSPSGCQSIGTYALRFHHTIHECATEGGAVEERSARPSLYMLYKRQNVQELLGLSVRVRLPVRCDVVLVHSSSLHAGRVVRVVNITGPRAYLV